MDLEVKLINFQKSFNEISVGEQLLVYTYIDGNSQKANLQVVGKEDQTIYLQDMDNNKPIEWNYVDFIENKYHILDIIREARFQAEAIPNQVFKMALEDFEPQAVNIEIQYIQKAEYEKVYSIDEQVEDIYKYYISRLANPSQFAYMLANKKAHIIGELIENYTNVRDTENLALQKFTIDGRYISPILKPIIFDTKLVYQNDLVKDETDHRNLFVSYGESDLETTVLGFLNDAYKQYELSNNRNTQIKLNFKQLRNVEYGFGELATEVKGIGKSISIPSPYGSSSIHIVPYNPYTTPLFDIPTSFQLRSKITFDAYRYVSPSNTLTIAEGKQRDETVLLYDRRRVRGPIYYMRDNADERLISEQANCQVCRGTAKTAEGKYFNPLDKDIPASRINFNKCITKEPSEDIAVAGENVKLAGFVLHNPAQVVPSYNNLIKIEKAPLSTILYSTEGYWNMIDRVIQSRKYFHLTGGNGINEIRDITTERIDYNKTNFIYLNGPNKSLSKDELTDFVKSVVPNPERVLKIEEDQIKQANNITDLNKILSKYFLTMKNFNIHQVKQVEELFNDRATEYRENVQLEKAIKEYYVKTNQSIDTIFSNIYTALFTIEMNKDITIEDIAKLFDHYIKHYDMDLLKHILTFYFGIEIHYADAKEYRNILVSSFFDRYTDYLVSDSPVRILLHPEVQIPTTFSQKLVRALKKYYGILGIKHRTTRIGLINEMYHIMFVRDSMENFNAFYDYIYALNSIQKLRLAGEELKTILKSRNLDNELKLINEEITRQRAVMIIEQEVCNKYHISKIYSNMGDLLKDNGRDEVAVDPIFSRHTAIAKLLKLESSAEDIAKVLADTIPELSGREAKEIIANGLPAKELVGQGAWCLLIQGDDYSVYEREGNQWIYRMAVPESCRVEPIRGKKGNIEKPIQLDILCNLEGHDLSSIKTAEDLIFTRLEQSELTGAEAIAKKCKSYGVGCIPKGLFNLYTLRDRRLSLKKATKYFEEQIDINSAIVYDRVAKLERFLDQMETSEKKQFQKQLHQYKEEPVVKKGNPILAQYMEQYQLIKNIPDRDVQLNELDKFITNHGLLNRKLVNNKLERVSVSDSTWIYYDIPGEITPMCCKHNLLLIKQAWKSNVERNKLHEILVNQWGIVYPEVRYVFCKNCGETIGYTKESDMEGFDEDDKVVRLREAVYDFLEDEDDYSSYFLPSGSVKALTYDFLTSLMKSLKMNLNRDQIFEIVNDCSTEVARNLEDKYTFEANILVADQPSIPQLNAYFKTLTEKKGGATTTTLIQTYKSVRKSQTQLEILNDTELARIKANNTSGLVGKVDRNAQVFMDIFDDFMRYYNSKKMFLIMTTLIGKLATVLVSTYPEIKILGDVERTGRIRNLGNYMANPKATLKNISDISFAITKEVTKADSIQKIFVDYFTELTLTPKGKAYKSIAPDQIAERLDSAVLSSYEVFSGTKLFQERITQKMRTLGWEQGLLVERTARSSPWKTFRPILQIVPDVDTELAKMDLTQLETIINDPHTNENQAKFVAFQLSYRLFYSIQKVLEDQPLAEGEKFTNYCCLSSMRAKYMDFFISKDPSILKCIELMARIQPKAFYNPNQQLVAIVGDTIQVETLKLLDYIEEGRRMLDIKELKSRITRLLEVYALLDGENGKRRVYSKYYDTYLANSRELTKQQIADDMRKNYPDWSETDIEARVDNLYRKDEPGLIVEDIDNQLYGWDIKKSIDQIIDSGLENKAQLLGIYDNLVRRLYLASKLFINTRGYQRVDLKIQYDTVETQRETYYRHLLDTYNQIAFGILSEENEDAKGLYPGFFDLVEKCKTGVYGETAMKDVFFAEYNEDNKRLRQLLPEFKLENLARCEDQRKERLDGLINQIRIEGYREDEIEAQLNIRRSYIDTAMSYYRLDELKKYYAFIATVVYRFKFVNTDIYSLPGFYKNKYRELDEEFVDNLQLDNISSRFWLKTNIFKTDVYINLDKRFVLEPVSVALINKLVAFEQRVLANGATIIPGLVSTRETRFVVLYFIQKALLGLLASNWSKAEQDLVVRYVNYIINHQLKPMEERNCLTDKQVSLHLRNLFTKQNRKRRDRYHNMDGDQKNAYLLYRQLGLGNLFGDNQSVDDEQNDLNVEKAYQDGDGLAMEKEVAMGVAQAEAELHAVYGEEVPEAIADLALDEQAKEREADLEAAKEFGMAKGSADVDDYAEGNDDYLD